MQHVSTSLIVCLCVAAISGGCAAPRGSGPGLSLERHEAGLQAFEQVWTTIRDRHWDPTYNGVDWQAVRDELRPRAEAARSEAEVQAILQDMVSRLGQTHFAILPRTVYTRMTDVDDRGRPDGATGGAAGAALDAEGDDETGADGVTGLRVRARGAGAIVVRVDPGSPAAGLGVRPGWSVLRVGGTDVDELARDLARSYGESTLLPATIALTVEGLLSGPAGTDVDVVLEDGAGAKRPLSLPRHAPSGRPASIGHLPTMYIDFEARTLDDSVGYIRFDAFLDPPWIMASFADAVRRFTDAPGIVLDLRGNPGGIGAMAMGIGGWFVDRPNQHLGTMRTRDTELNFVLNPRAGAYGGPLAVLVDSCSMSTSEILAGGLQDLGRARVFGTRTAGAALPSIIERLATGDGFQYAFAHYTSVGGQELEGHGVVPDVLVEPDPGSLLEGRDPTLEAAVAWIREEQRRPDAAGHRQEES